MPETLQTHAIDSVRLATTIRLATLSFTLGSSLGVRAFAIPSINADILYFHSLVYVTSIPISAVRGWSLLCKAQ